MVVPEVLVHIPHPRASLGCRNFLGWRDSGMGKEMVVTSGCSLHHAEVPGDPPADGPQHLRADKTPQGLPRGASLHDLSAASTCNLSKDLRLTSTV